MNTANNDDFSTIFDDIEATFSQSFSITVSAIIEDINEHFNVVLASVKSRAKHFQKTTLRELETLRANKENDRILVELNNQRDFAEVNEEDHYTVDYEQVMIEVSNIERQEQIKEKESKQARYEPQPVESNNVTPKAKSDFNKPPKQEKVSPKEIKSSSSLNEEQRSFEDQSKTIQPVVSKPVTVLPSNCRPVRQSSNKGSTSLIECPKCGKVFSSKTWLATHEKHIHGGEDGKIQTYQCDKCDFNTKHKNGLTYHSKSKHEGTKFYRNAFGTFPA